MKNETQSGKHLSEVTCLERQTLAFGEGKVNLRLRKTGEWVKKRGETGRRGFQNERLEGSVAEPGCDWAGARL